MILYDMTLDDIKYIYQSYINVHINVYIKGNNNNCRILHI